MDQIFDAYVEAGQHPAHPGRLHARGAVRRPTAPTSTAGRSSDRIHDDHDRLGRRRPTTSGNGAAWSRPGRGTWPTATARTRSRPGPGKSGTSPTATTGPARSPSSARCTTHARRRSSAALPGARVGGPHTCGAFANEKAQTFLRGFLAHVVDTGSPIDFIAFHAKGNPVVHDGHVRMGLHKQLRDIETNLGDHQRIPRAQGPPGGDRRIRPRGLRRLLGARASAERLPQRPALRRLCRREHAAHLRAVAPRRHRDRGRGDLGLPVRRPALFRRLPRPRDQRHRQGRAQRLPHARQARRRLGRGDEQPRARASRTIMEHGVRGAPDVNAVATRDDKGVSILAWHYHDDDVAGRRGRVTHRARRPAGRAAQLRHYRMDEDHSNAFGVWKAMGSPQDPSTAPTTPGSKPPASSRRSSRGAVEVDGGRLDLRDRPAAPGRVADPARVVIAPVDLRRLRTCTRMPRACVCIVCALRNCR